MATSITNTSISTDTINVDNGVLYVDNVNNRVGVGTASPERTLHVAGISALFDSDTYGILELRVDNNDDQTNNDGIIKITTGSASLTKAELRYDESEDLVHLSYGDHGRNISISSSGNVGIGTGSTAPGADLHVKDASGAWIEVEGPGSGDIPSGIGLYNSTTLESSWYVNPTHDTTFLSRNAFNIRTNNAMRMQIDSSGRVRAPYQAHIHGSPTKTGDGVGIANSFSTSRSRNTLTFSNDRITVPVDGVYLICINTIGNRETGRRDIQIKVNGSNVAEALTPYGTDSYQQRNLSIAITLSANDYIQFWNELWYDYNTAYTTWRTASVTLLS